MARGGPLGEMPRDGPLEVLVVSLGSTAGLRRADEQLCGSLLRAGANAAIARARPPAAKRTLMATDLAWARAARAAAVETIAAAAGDRGPPAVIYSSTTAALLWPRPGAVRFDAPSAANRPGRHGYWQRPLERRRLAQAPLLLPWSDQALGELPPGRTEAPALVVPVAVETEPVQPAQSRDIAAITYAANPAKKGLDRVLAAWRRVRESGAPSVRAGEGELVVAGADQEELERAGVSAREEGVHIVGALPHEQYLGLLARARVFVCAPRREDYGIAQLEALAHGCLLVSTPAPGPYLALEIARGLDERLVSEDLAGALYTALSDPTAGYAGRARAALAPFRQQAVDAIVAEQLLPRLRLLAQPR